MKMPRRVECLCFVLMMFECLNSDEKHKHRDETTGRVWATLSRRRVLDGDSGVDRARGLPSTRRAPLTWPRVPTARPTRQHDLPFLTEASTGLAQHAPG